MLLDLAALRASAAAVPAEWHSFVARDDDVLTVVGDPTSAVELFLHTGSESAVIATDLGELLDHLRSAGVPTPLSPFGISALLHHGVVPLPHCEFQDIAFLTMGDRFQLRWGRDGLVTEPGVDFPWLSFKSRQDNSPSEATLLELLTASTARALGAAGNRGFLMMSSGKDSAAVALALAELGRSDVPCVTYSSGPDDPEPRVAAEICQRLGLDHTAVEMPADSREVEAILTRFFTESARPGVDLAQIPYAVAVAGAEAPGGVVLDGGGNDAFMGLPVSGKVRTKMRSRIRGRILVDLAQRVTKVDSSVNYAAKTRAEAALAGRNLRFHETRQFMPDAVDTRDYWYRLDKETAHLSPLDVMAYMERNMGPGASQKKHLLAAKAMGYTAAVPWCDAAVAEYYFHLPEDHRYDIRQGTNKVLLRRMLLEYLDYDASKIGKHYFGFGGAKFVIDNTDFIRSEIRSCALWDRSRLGIVEAWLGEIERRPLLYHAILDVFMVSGWHNHSRYVRSVPQAVQGVGDE